MIADRQDVIESPPVDALTRSPWKVIPFPSRKSDRNQHNAQTQPSSTVREKDFRVGLHLGEMYTDRDSGLTRERYRVLKKIGEGGQGSIYRAEDLSGRKVVIKTLPTALKNSFREIELLKREATAMAKLDHPNIPRVFDYFIDKQFGPAFVLKREEGQTIRESLKSKYHFSPQEVWHVMSDVTEALTFVHSKGFKHGDLSPGNILIGNERTKLLDFGISEQFDEGFFNFRHGTPTYTAPENILRSYKEIPERRREVLANIYSLGTIVYEMLTGEKLFKLPQLGIIHPFDWVLLQQIGLPLRIQKYPSLQKFTHKAHVNQQKVEAFLNKCLAFNPKQRYQSFEEFMSGLNEALQPVASEQRGSLVLNIAEKVVQILQGKHT